MPVWKASVTFNSLLYQAQGGSVVGNAINNFVDNVPYSPFWKERGGRHFIGYTLKFKSRTKKNKVLKFLRKLHEKDDNLQWYIEKDAADYFDSDSSSDEYDDVHTCYAK